MALTYLQRIKLFAEKYIPSPIKIIGGTNKTNDFDNLCNVFYSAIATIATEAQKESTKSKTKINKDKMARAIINLKTVNENIAEAYNSFKSRKANNLSSKEKTVHENLDGFLAHKAEIEKIPNEKLKKMILDILNDIQALGNVDAVIPDQIRIDRLTNEIIPIFIKATSKDLITLLMAQLTEIDTEIPMPMPPTIPEAAASMTFQIKKTVEHVLERPIGDNIDSIPANMHLPNTEDETVFEFKPDIITANPILEPLETLPIDSPKQPPDVDNKLQTADMSFPDVSDITTDARERRQQKAFAKRTHTSRSMRDNYDTEKPVQQSADLINALESKTNRLFSEFDAKNRYSEEYEPEDVSKNISDKKEIFQKKGLNFTSNNQKANFSITQNISPTRSINILDVDCQSNAKKEITQVTLTQHSNLNRSKVMVTEELSILGRALHADYVGVSSLRRDGSVNIENVIQGSINALYANLLPTYDKVTLDALQKYNSSDSKILLEIYKLSSNESDPNRKWNAFKRFENEKEYLSDPFARIRTARSGDAP